MPVVAVVVGVEVGAAVAVVVGVAVAVVVGVAVAVASGDGVPVAFDEVAGATSDVGPVLEVTTQAVPKTMRNEPKMDSVAFMTLVVTTLPCPTPPLSTSRKTGTSPNELPPLSRERQCRSIRFVPRNHSCVVERQDIFTNHAALIHDGPGR